MKKAILGLLVLAIAATSAAQRTSRQRSDYAEDTAHVDADWGRMCLAVRTDTTPGAIAGTTGDYTPFQVDANGSLYVTSAGAGDPAIAYIEDVAETVAMQMAMCGTVRRDTAASSADTTGDNASLNTDATGNLWTVAATTTIAGATAAVEDVAETAAGPLVMSGSVRRDVAASSADTTGDNATINTDATGNLWVVSSVLEDVGETAANPLLGIGVVRRDVLVPSCGASGDNCTVNQSANGAAWVESAMVASAYGSSPPAVTAGVFGAPIADLEGRPYVNTAHPFAINCHLASAATTSTQVTGCELVSGKSIYITMIAVGGDAANPAGTPWQIQEGTSTGCTGPTVLASGFHGANETTVITFPTPIKGTAAEGLCLLDGTTGTKSVTITGYVAP